MPLYVLGLNHRTAPIDIRESVAFANERLRAGLESLQAATAADEALLVSTCNRTEIYLRATDDSVLHRAAKWLGDSPHASQYDLTPHLYRHSDRDAAQHAFRVASGLDSMILGEPQILGQVKHAVKLAHETGAMGGALARLFQQTFQVAKKVRAETEIGSASVSMAAASLKLAMQLFENIQTTRVLLIGVGDMIQLAATHFASVNPAAMVVANRTLARGRDFASQFSVNRIVPMSLAELPDVIHEFDIVITSTASTLPIIGKGMVEQALKRRRSRPMMMVDLAVPRDIEPEVAQLEDVYLYTLDSLGKLIQQNLSRRAGAVAAAEGIITAETDQFMQWLTARNVVPVIQSLRTKADQYRQIELARAERMLARGDAPTAVITSLANGLTNKFLHHPLAALNQASELERERLADTLMRLYPVDESNNDNEADTNNYE
jgi:glutamyl-tRNA reductase